MASYRNVERVAIVGTGTIGASWAAHYLAHGFDVVATDPGPGAEDALRDYVDRAWDTVTALGLAPGASRDRLSFTKDLQGAVDGADFVQEHAPERLELKVKLFADIDEATSVDAMIASSSSGIPMSDIQTACKHPERTVIGHPFNPPHVIPLVEVVGGKQTADETIEAAMAFYAAVGKRPIQLHKELPGHVANRLQSALYREIVYLIDQGVLDVEAADDAVSWGPGLRWGVMGPSLLWHLGGGAGGIEHFMDTLMDPMAAAWKTLGNPQMTPELKQKIIAGVLQETGGRSIDELSADRDAMLLGLQAIRAEHGTAQPLGSPSAA
jgi:carnitine 3-dehydrogenase